MAGNNAQNNTTETFNMSGLKIVQMNVNSIRSNDKRHQLDEFLKTQKPHIFLCSETNLINTNKIAFKNYNIHRVDRKSNGGGTAIFVNSKIAYESVTLPPDIKSIECCAIKIIPNNGPKIKKNRLDWF